MILTPGMRCSQEASSPDMEAPVNENVMTSVWSEEPRIPDGVRQQRTRWQPDTPGRAVDLKPRLCGSGN